ncbi:hypothetical protein BN6_19750 [Saccharothrix espanaensis DSM 44229]|uniref:Uncharacterized protein n=1 Tax=Saccharothrix espanaensis (strain ATCC 51144 / DSM 44229 / JCM 9112 / NBRC 15066 / NRRL 15764) TaxID=1179773 RepID=K0JPY4_SACES|nr:hypothetical protein BN6_19750 [Saccharothrix espanaensis DSM 44229]
MGDRVAPERTTPACAGKTRAAPCAPPPRWDHPRVRGEDFKHARDYPRPHKRTTPACAGKTTSR